MMTYLLTNQKKKNKPRNEFAFCRGFHWFNKCQNITDPKAGNNFLKPAKNLHTSQGFGTSWYEDWFWGYRFTHWLRLFLGICFVPITVDWWFIFILFICSLFIVTTTFIVTTSYMYKKIHALINVSYLQ